MRILALGILLFFGQEARDLRWDLKEKQSFDASWTIELRTDRMRPEEHIDLKVETSAVLTVTSIGKSSCTMDLSVTRCRMTGLSWGSPVDIHYEDGVLKIPAGVSRRSKDLKQQFETKLQLALYPRGILTFANNSLVRECTDGDAGFLGGTLPDRPVAPGDHWSGPIESRKSRKLGVPALEARYKLKGISEGVATIEMKTSKDLVAGGKTYRLSAAGDILFNQAAGHLSKSTLRLEGTDMTDRKEAPESPDFISTTTVELKLRK